MNLFVFRNNTVERFFPKDYTFSGYDDISTIPTNAYGYVWFYQAPIGCNQETSIDIIKGYQKKFDYVLAHSDATKTMIALTMEPVYAVPLTEDDYSVRGAIEEYNAALLKAAETHANLKVIDYSDFTRNYPVTELIDWKFYFISYMGINPKLTKDFQTWWQRKLEGITLNQKKCIVLDLDNTLWGGVLGEDGVNGIKIGGDYPGNAFFMFQSSLFQLSKKGIILTICSKNNEEEVLEAWEKNPFMALRKEHFAAYRINWKDKATNVKEIAEELNIGLDSMVFVDDNPVERELIKQMLPMVTVPDFPAQPYELPSFFKKLVDDYFKVYSITDEDKNKTEQYKANASRAQAQHQAEDFGAFLESLDIQMTIETANEFNIPRIAQMTQKTNQFNLTTKRYTDADLRELIAKGSNIWCVSVADRFGDSGITGCVIVKPSVVAPHQEEEYAIDTFLLSCRILGKGIEKAFLTSVLSLLRNRGIKSIRGEYIPTAKNAQVADFYDHCGFRCVKDNVDGSKSYVLELKDADLGIDKYYHIIVK